MSGQREYCGKCELPLREWEWCGRGFCEGCEDQMSSAKMSFYRLWRDNQRTTATALSKAASEFGLSVCLKRVPRGYSTRCVGGSNKLPDDVFIEWEGVRYGSGSSANGSFATETLRQFTEDVFDKLDNDVIKSLHIEYHKECLRDLGVVV